MNTRLRTCIVLGTATLLLTACGSSRRHEAELRAPDTASRLRVASAAMESGQTDIALSMFGAAAEAAPESVEAQTKYAALLIRAGKPEVADKVLARALEAKPNDPALQLALGKERIQTGAAAEALQLFDGLLARDGRNVAALNGRGMALDLLDRHAQAQQSYRAAQAIAPSDIPSANNLALSLLLEGRAAEAQAVLIPLSRRAGVPARVLNNLAIAQAAASGRGGAGAGLASGPSSEDLRTLAGALNTGATIAYTAPASSGAGTVAPTPSKPAAPQTERRGAVSRFFGGIGDALGL